MQAAIAIPPTSPKSNREIGDALREAAALLERQGASARRVGAYRRAADTIETLHESVADRLDREGIAGVTSLPDVGGALAAAVREIVRTGRWGHLERLRGELEPEKLFQTVPGVGPTLARRIHDRLHVDTLEDLEVAAYDGRLEAVPGIGHRRIANLRASLAAALARVRGAERSTADSTAGEPPVEVLLDVDREYRARAAARELPTIAPRRFNPSGEAWLPVLHTQRGPWHLTALFSNTARAHQLGKTDDWVVLYFDDGDHHERQRTVVTETRGPLAGKRVVRGREAEHRRPAA